MASQSSKVSKVSTRKVNRRGRVTEEGVDSYYKTEVTTLADGSVQREVYRTDANGNNQVQIQKVTVLPNGNLSQFQINSTATEQEKKALQNPDSELRKTVKQQVESTKDTLSEENIDGATKDTIDKAANVTKDQKTEANDAKTNENDEEDQQSPTGPTELTDIQQRTDYQQVLKYPIDIDTNFQDFIKIMMVEYNPRGFDFAAGGLGIETRGNLQTELSDTDAAGREILSNIYLAIPNGISDSNVVGWGNDKIDPLKAAAAQIGSDMLLGDDVSNTVKNIAGGVQKNSDGVKTGAAAAILKGITGVDSALQRQTGAVLNNNIELLFTGPELRKFTFSFEFSPRSEGEAEEIKKIIRTLKQGMSPKKSNGFLFIKSPHTFFLGYYQGGTNKLHPYLNKIKECALTGLSVQYAPDGNYATYRTGSMTKYVIQMQFAELEPVFDDDYGNDYDNIGF